MNPAHGCASTFNPNMAKGETAMKAIGATLFAILFIMFAVSMPVHAQYINYLYPNTKWRITANIDEMTDKIILSRFGNEYKFYDRYKDGISSIRLEINCIFGFDSIGVSSRDNAREFSDKYQSFIRGIPSTLLVRVDNDYAFYIRVDMNFSRDFIYVHDSTYLLSRLQNHNFLRMEIFMKTGRPIVAKFDITGFNEAFEHYRLRFCN